MKKHLFKTLKPVLGLISTVLLTACTVGTDKVEKLIPEGFVKIDECCYESKGASIHMDAFEILDHPVTNREYKAFTDATAYPAPPHWKNGCIPEGKEEYPVVFVNRDDVTAYTEWLTELEERVYRIPTPPEFEIAARGGKKTIAAIFGEMMKVYWIIPNK
ncbi:MAG: formylglycine-generating enzyme family protein [Bacteroides intestinalis]|nr:formylglycine-generating enzyme family protein [Bacteroides intestinalis]